MIPGNEPGRRDGTHRYDAAGDMISSTFPGGIPAPKRKLWPWILAAVGAMILLVICVGALGSLVGADGDAVQRRGGSDKLAPVATSTPAPKGAPPTADRSVTIKDLTATLKITDKQCFGSAGCSLTGHVVLAVGERSLFSDRLFDVTYEIRGIQDGPLIGSVRLEDGQYSEQNEFFMTAGSRSKVTVALTDIEERL